MSHDGNTSRIEHVRLCNYVLVLK